MSTLLKANPDLDSLITAEMIEEFRASLTDVSLPPLEIDLLRASSVLDSEIEEIKSDLLSVTEVINPRLLSTSFSNIGQSLQAISDLLVDIELETTEVKPLTIVLNSDIGMPIEDLMLRLYGWGV